MSKKAVKRIRIAVVVTLVLLGLIWSIQFLAPIESGIHFGVSYGIFTTIVVVGAFFFFLLIGARTSMPLSTRVAFGNILVVVLVAVSIPLLIGVSYPQFEIPQPEGAKEAERQAAERGKELFVSPKVACFACHSVQAADIRGGTRAPDLSEEAKKAPTRIPGVPAEEYIREHIKRGSDPKYFVVADYPPIMPPFRERLTEQELDDLVAFLISLRQGNSTVNANAAK